jgi:hypothetical protein
MSKRYPIKFTNANTTDLLKQRDIKRYPMLFGKLRNVILYFFVIAKKAIAETNVIPMKEHE